MELNTSWSLDSIYTGIDSTEFKSDVQAFKKAVAELNAWAKTAFNSDTEPQRIIYEYIVMKNRLMQYDKLAIYVNLLLAVDTENEELASMLDSLEQISSDTAEHEARFSSYIKCIDNLDEIIKDNSLLSEHSYFLKETKRTSEHTLSHEQELIIARLKNTGSSLWARQWEQLTSNLMIDFECEGKSYSEPLSAVRNMAYSGNKSLRFSAYKAELSAYEQIKVPSAFCMNGIKGEVLTVSKMRGYESPLKMTLAQSRLSESALNAMWSAVKNALPKLTEYFTLKAQLLGYGDKLPFYDLFAPVGEEKTYTVEQARDIVVNCFTSFSREMGEFADNAFKNAWIDLMPRKGKTGGAFCEAVHAVKESRIMTNFSGSFEDVITIAHELGHAYHDTKLYNATPINSFYPMPIAETASTLCETIVIGEVLKSADKGTALSILDNDLSGIMQTLSDIYSRFLFEDNVFKAKAEGMLSADRLCTLMLDAQREAYGNKLDEEYMHPYMWVCKPHYYDADFNYYNFPYAFGMLLSKALYAKSRQMGEDFVSLYSDFLSATGTSDLEEVASLADFELTNEAFWQSGIKIIEDEIEEYKNLIKDLK